MAGDWLKMEVSLPEKPEVFHIASVLGIDPDEVIGKLFKVWRWFDAHTENGNAASVTYALVDRISGRNGFAEAMAFSGWLVQDGATLRVPNFDRHNGKTAKERALTAKRVAKSKAKSNGGGNATGNGESVTLPLPREEKRREEKRRESQPKAASAARTYLGWVNSLPDDQDPLPATDPVFAYAKQVGLSDEFMALAWAWFETTYGPDGPRSSKRYTDWRKVFRGAVEGNWGKLWYVDGEGYRLTTVGLQLQRSLKGPA